jgi:hypothetical protein
MMDEARSTPRVPLSETGTAIGSATHSSSLSPSETPLVQILKDLSQIRSSHGYLLMRIAVAKDAQDAYNVCKGAFQDADEALKRLEDSVPGWLHTWPAEKVSEWLVSVRGVEARAETSSDTKGS